jgi:membrane protein
MVLIKNVFRRFIISSTFEKGAALSFYTVFSFLPITMIITYLLGNILKQDSISRIQNNILDAIVGEQGALQLEAIIGNQQLDHQSGLSALFGVGAILLASTGMFNQVQRSINSIWGLKAKPKKSVFSSFMRYIMSLSFLMIVGLILLLSTLINSLLYKYSASLPDTFVNAHVYENLISFCLITLLFFFLFKFSGNAIVPWKTALVSGGFTSILFFIGKLAFGIYIARSNINSAFGAASAIALLMIWVYYTSQILFIGASFAYEFGQKTGWVIRAKKHVVKYKHG